MIRLTAVRAAAALAALALAFAATAAATPAPKRPAKPGKTRVEIATFAMGCFWSAESQFEGQPGVLSAVSGYTGGTERNPTYDQVSSGGTGHYESVQVTFDPGVTSYEKLLDNFWHAIDPTQANGQFCDHGRHYLSAVFGHNARQLKLAEESKRAIAASGVLKDPIVTEIRPAGRFWPAEEYHQDFAQKNPAHYGRYRVGCGRDRRLAEVWGDLAAKPVAH